MSADALLADRPCMPRLCVECGHHDQCIRHDLTATHWDPAAQAAAEDGATT